MALALRVLTRMKGLTPLIFMTAVKPEAPIEIPNRVSDLSRIAIQTQLAIDPDNL
jgi:hypothetical protein